MAWQILFDLCDQLGVVGAVGIKPEDNGAAGNTSAFYREFYPILYRRVFHSAHAPNITALDIMGVHHVAGLIDDLDASRT